jgi:hypothetical protein
LHDADEVTMSQNPFSTAFTTSLTTQVGRPLRQREPSDEQWPAPSPPWLVVRGGTRALEDAIADAGQHPGLVRTVRGRRADTSEGLFAEFARVWQFPAHFGYNWSALEDCLSDLSWVGAPGYVTIVEGAERLLAEEPPGILGQFGDLIVRVAEYWAAEIEDGEAWDRPAQPFRAILVTSTPGRARALTARLAAAGVGDVELASDPLDVR